jgi:hypothetical protein
MLVAEILGIITLENFTVGSYSTILLLNGDLNRE